DQYETYSTVARSTTIKVILAIVAAYDLGYNQMDVITSFLNGVLGDDEHVYIK
ncbi:hypothetical protein K504DRAFT_361162, partial [Pleomassaria siparia CBS 279.74]